MKGVIENKRKQTNKQTNKKQREKVKPGKERK